MPKEAWCTGQMMWKYIRGGRPTQQHLWYYKEGKLLMDSDFVSGTYYNYDRRHQEALII